MPVANSSSNFSKTIRRSTKFYRGMLPKMHSLLTPMIPSRQRKRRLETSYELHAARSGARQQQNALRPAAILKRTVQWPMAVDHALYKTAPLLYKQHSIYNFTAGKELHVVSATWIHRTATLFAGMPHPHFIGLFRLTLSSS